MNNMVFMQDLAVVMIAAGLAALICHWLKQPKILGYILAGLVIGPHTPPFALITEESSVLTLADLGVTFLMFCLGLEFHLRKLRSVGISAVIVAVTDVAFMLWIGFMLGRALGWTALECIFLGAILCDSSTTVITRLLDETRQTREKFAGLIVGATLVEDLLAVTLLALLSGLAITGTVQPEHVLVRLGALGIFLVTILVVGLLLVRRFINYIAQFQNNELLLITVLGIGFSVSLLAVRLQFSLALGAFLIGAIMAESKASDRIGALTQTIRDLFAPVFFVAIGMLLDPAMIARHVWTILLITAALIAGKLIGASFGAWASGNDRRTSFRVGCGMAQICEFALIIAALGASLHVTREFVYPIAVSVAVLTIFLNPYLMRDADRMSDRLEAWLPPSLIGTMAFYTRWIGNLRRLPFGDRVMRVLLAGLRTLLINLALIAAIFILAAFLARRSLPIPALLPEAFGGNRTLLWLGGAILAVPLYVATFRKMEAMGMILAEIRFPVSAGSLRTTIARRLMEKMILLLGVIGLALFTLLLTSALLPPWPVLLILLALLIVGSMVFWKFNIRIYATAQSALREVFVRKPSSVYIDPITAMPYVFREAKMASIPIPANSHAVQQRISELALRTHTGASVIGIERGGEMLVNPRPDEVVQAGDVILLIGLHQQLEKARELLTTAPA